ncbi:hypothetical protein [Saccharomonospora viridis]|jgi:hypothetical protein|uniref:hypothetical protein n=1 Tax=Saccharomonospora viridis TaxID=1852 RepID=UPI0001A37B09|nr:hypothetical protein [Saccharomonospora viridis]
MSRPSPHGFATTVVTAAFVSSTFVPVSVGASRSAFGETTITFSGLTVTRPFTMPVFIAAPVHCFPMLVEFLISFFRILTSTVLPGRSVVIARTAPIDF